MNKKAALVLLGVGGYLALSRNANAGVRYQGGFVDPGPLSTYGGDAALAVDNLLATVTRDSGQAIPDYTEVIPADIPWEWPQDMGVDPYEIDGAQGAGNSDYVDPYEIDGYQGAGSWGQYDSGDWNDGGGRIIPVGNFVNGEKNLSAFLKMIRTLEGTNSADGYQALYGYRPGNGKVFTDFADHPRISFKTPWGKTSAAGAYQMQAGTWDEMAEKYGLTDFSPANQDRAALGLITRFRAVDDIVAGRLYSAIKKLASQWASLPSSKSGQPKYTWEDAKRIFLSNAGDVDINDPETTIYV